MPLAGNAVMLNWSDVTAEDRPAFYEWHNREHMVGAMELGGFQRGRRYIAVNADRDFFNCYEVDNLDALVGSEYRAKVNNPSELSLRTDKVLRNSVRGLAHVKVTLGIGIGGFALTLRLDVKPGNEAGLHRYLAEDALPKVVGAAEMVGAHYFVSDIPASTYVPVERRGRTTEVPPWVIMLEGTALDPLNKACDEHLSHDTLTSHGATGPFARGTYRHEISIAKIPRWRN